jgi:hypothetical protein
MRAHIFAPPWRRQLTLRPTGPVSFSPRPSQFPSQFGPVQALSHVAVVALTCVDDTRGPDMNTLNWNWEIVCGVMTLAGSNLHSLHLYQGASDVSVF